jgi:hypothetical protein
METTKRKIYTDAELTAIWTHQKAISRYVINKEFLTRPFVLSDYYNCEAPSGFELADYDNSRSVHRGQTFYF